MGWIIGVDLGTSSVKALAVSGKKVREASAKYAGEPPECFLPAAARAVEGLEMDPAQAESIGLSGQTGSYLYETDRGRAYVRWSDPGREACLNKLLRDISRNRFIEYTGMAHPRLSSYPLPTMLYLADRYPDLKGGRLMQPKDYLCRALCGETVSDPFTWRGLARADRGVYSGDLLAYAGFTVGQLPVLKSRSRFSAQGAALLHLPEGLPVYTGCNDFYAALLGAGIDGPGKCFDIAGTSEHFGIVQSAPADSPLILSPYFRGYLHYGVTGSSGPAHQWSQRVLGEGDAAISQDAPVFLPYLNGERAPVFDERARGIFFGIGADSGADVLRYSVLEGIVFSLYDIFEHMGAPEITGITATGGAAGSELTNRLKASIFGVPVHAQKQICGSAAGAAMLAGAEIPLEYQTVSPEAALGDFLRARYQVYRRLYPAYREIIRSAGGKAWGDL